MQPMISKKVFLITRSPIDLVSCGCVMYKQGRVLVSEGTQSQPSHFRRLYCPHHRERSDPIPDQSGLPFPFQKCDVRERMWVSLNSNDQKQKREFSVEREKENKCKPQAQPPRKSRGYQSVRFTGMAFQHRPLGSLEGWSIVALTL